MRYFDGECSWLQRLRAERLLRSNVSARGFYELLESTSSGIREICDASGERAWTDVRVSAPTDVWDRISERVAQATRTPVVPEPRHIRFMPATREFVARLQWGLSGAALASIVAVLVAPSPDASQSEGMQRMAFNSGYHPATALSNGALSNGALSNAGELNSVNYTADDIPSQLRTMERQRRFTNERGGGDELRLPPELLAALGRSGLAEPPYPRALEVDWMRSRGRVRVMHDPEERTSIIWIRRPERSQGAGSLPLRRSRSEPVRVLEAGSSSSPAFGAAGQGGR